jgi:hypothetical protein
MQAIHLILGGRLGRAVADRVWMGVTIEVATGVLALLTNWEFPYHPGFPLFPFPHLCLYHLREGWHMVDLVLHSTGHFGAVGVVPGVG